MLGVVQMSAAMPSGTEGHGVSAKDRVEAAIAQLERALDLLDSAKTPPELAARVQEALDAIEAYRSS
jgi:prefoldin subunit 5